MECRSSDQLRKNFFLRVRYFWPLLFNYILQIDMLLKNQYLTFFLGFAMTFLVSCNGAVPREEYRFSYDQVKAQIDAGNFDEAQYDLEEQLRFHPEDNHARVLLGSVYVARAGISIKDYFRLYRIFQAPKSAKKSFIQPEILRQATATSKDLGKKLKGIDDFYGTMIDIRDRFSKIRKLSEEQALYLRQAILELNLLPSPAPGQLFYRGIVKLIYFKYLFENDLFFSFQKGKVCSTSVKNLRRQVDTFRIYFSGMLNDVAHGYPEQQKSIESFSRGSSTALNLFLFALSTGDQERKFSDLLREAMPKEKIKCDF